MDVAEHQKLKRRVEVANDVARNVERLQDQLSFLQGLENSENKQPLTLSSQTDCMFTFRPEGRLLGAVLSAVCHALRLELGEQHQLFKQI